MVPRFPRRRRAEANSGQLVMSAVEHCLILSFGMTFCYNTFSMFGIIGLFFTYITHILY
jgi:hypothetical protein